MLRRNCMTISYIALFSTVEFIALALAVVAIMLPLWLDPVDSQSAYQWSFVGEMDDGTVVQITHAGLWEVCFEPILENNTRLELQDGQKFVDITRQYFRMIGSENCRRGSTVEKFYSNSQNFGKNVLPEVIMTRAAAILFTIFALVKIVNYIIKKCTEGRPKYHAIVALIEVVLGIVALTNFGLVFTFVSDQQNDELEQRTVPGDFWGVSYWLFVSSVGIAIIADLGICF
eukprot:TRINITY_DN9683_c2_g3_i1.p2 TRINITY_DN9683_c2_g3~~TRINITY_DN9683_c2_g3_i1.p2  ORF type:complete len:245 (-),score=9.45 TRINITY_DN9683_c2_g3_i1:538-1227(-)